MRSELLDKNTIKKILVIRNDNIGDLICTTPMIHALKKRFKDASVSVLVNRYNKEAVEGSELIDECFVYDKLKHGRHKSRLSAWFELYRVISEIKKREFDLLISARTTYSPSVARMAFFSGARWRLGYVPAKGILPRFFYNIPAAVEDKVCHEVDKIFALVKHIGVNKDDEGLIINIIEAERKNAEDYLRENGVKKGDFLAAMHISSRRTENRWPVERFIKIGNFLSEKGIKVVVLWMPGDETNPLHPGDDEKADAIAQKMKGKAILYRTESVKGLIGMLSLCRLMICLDGGAMHIASALKMPIVALFGSTNPAVWGPYGDGHTVIKKGNDAKEIKASEVMEAINRKLPKKFLKAEVK